MKRSLLTNRLLMVRLAHRSNNVELFEKNMQECLTLCADYDKLRSITGDKEQQDMPWFDENALQMELHL